jgi:hypothetical protein
MFKGRSFLVSTISFAAVMLVAVGIIPAGVRALASPSASAASFTTTSAVAPVQSAPAAHEDRPAVKKGKNTKKAEKSSSRKDHSKNGRHSDQQSAGKPSGKPGPKQVPSDTRPARPGASQDASPDKAKPKQCRRGLIKVLRHAGFRGKNLREAWAIVMRESGGTAEIGPGHPRYNGADVGLFQWNVPTYAGENWWDTKKLMTAKYNAKIAFEISRGGKTWYPWGLDGKGRPNAVVYDSIWTDEMIHDRIIEPYQRWYKKYPC